MAVPASRICRATRQTFAWELQRIFHRALLMLLLSCPCGILVCTQTTSLMSAGDEYSHLKDTCCARKHSTAQIMECLVDNTSVITRQPATNVDEEGMPVHINREEKQPRNEVEQDELDDVISREYQSTPKHVFCYGLLREYCIELDDEETTEIIDPNQLPAPTQRTAKESKSQRDTDRNKFRLRGSADTAMSAQLTVDENETLKGKIYSLVQGPVVRVTLSSNSITREALYINKTYNRVIVKKNISTGYVTHYLYNTRYDQSLEGYAPASNMRRQAMRFAQRLPRFILLQVILYVSTVHSVILCFLCYHHVPFVQIVTFRQLLISEQLRLASYNMYTCFVFIVVLWGMYRNILRESESDYSEIS